MPGHERFLHNALAGLGGVRLLLLVVAADEGVKPQTREHLEIAELLELPGLIVALNKIDAVDAETAELAELEVAELLAATRFAGAPILPVSALTGAGVPALRVALEQAAAALDPPDRDLDPARLPVDRAFLLKGQGVVVTGTLISGTISPGDSPGAPARAPRPPAPAPSRCMADRARPSPASAPRCSSPVSICPHLARGMELATPGALRTTRRLLVRWQMLASSPVAFEGPLHPRRGARPPLRRGNRRHGPAARQTAGIAAGESGLVEIALAAPVVAVRGDRIVVRRPSPAATLGGGTILDPWWRRKRRGDPSARLAALAGDERSALLAWATEAAERGLTAAAAAARTGRSALAQRNPARRARSGRRARPAAPGGCERRAVLPVRRPVSCGRRRSRAVRRGARAALARYFAERPLELGLGKAEAARLLLPGAARALAEPYFARLQRSGDLDLAAGDVRFPGRTVEPPAALSPLARAIVERYTRLRASRRPRPARWLAPSMPNRRSSKASSSTWSNGASSSASLRDSSSPAPPSSGSKPSCAPPAGNASRSPTSRTASACRASGRSPSSSTSTASGSTRRVGEERQLRPPASRSKGLEPSPQG